MEKQLAYKTIKIDDRVKAVKAIAIEAAIAYQEVTGRKLGITGEIGEVVVAEWLGLELYTNPNAAGSDAIDSTEKKYQIKACRSGGRGRISSFSNHSYDFALLALLDDNYVMVELWQASAEILEPVLAMDPKRSPSISGFKRVATRIA